MIPLLCALLIGAALAVFGAGGSIVTVPVLVYGAGLDAHRAAGTSLMVVGLVALIGALAKHWAPKLRTALVFGAAGMVGALPGAWLNHHVPGLAVLVGFALTLLAAAWRMGRAAAATTRTRDCAHAGRALAAGAAVGVATGFFGVGGGFLIVPALTLLLGLPMPAAVATSLLIIALNSAVGVFAHGAYGAVDWRLGLEFAAAALIGAVAVAPFARRWSVRSLQRAFAGLLAAIGLAMLAQTVGTMLT